MFWNSRPQPSNRFLNRILDETGPAKRNFVIRMNIHELQSKLLPVVGEAKIFDSITKASHWVKKIKDSKEYVAKNDKEIEVITKFAELGIVKLERKENSVAATLTESGKDLHREFVARGYYL